MVLAISLKTYFAFLLIYPLLRGHKRFAIETAGLSVAINAILFLSFPGRPTVSFAGFFVSSSQFSNAANFDNIFNGTSLTSAIFHVTSLIEGRDFATDMFFQFENLLSVPGFLWLVVVALLAASRKVPYWASLTFALLTAALAIPAAWPYNYASVSLAALYFGTRESDPFPITRRPWLDRLERPGAIHSGTTTLSTTFLRWVVLGVIVVSLSPQFLSLQTPDGDSFYAYYLLAPLAGALGGLLALAWLLTSSLRQRPEIAQPTQR